MILSIHPVWTTNVIQNLSTSSLKHTYYPRLRLMPSQTPSQDWAWCCPLGYIVRKVVEIVCNQMVCVPLSALVTHWTCKTKSKLNPSWYIYIYIVANDQHRTIYGYLWQFMNMPYTLIRCHHKLWVPVCIGCGQCWKPIV